MPQIKGRTLNSGKPRDIADVEVYELDNGDLIATGQVLHVPSNLYFLKDEWCVVNDYLMERAEPEQRLCATEHVHTAADIVAAPQTPAVEPGK